MNVAELIRAVRDVTTEAFAAIDVWFDKEADLRQYRPRRGGWTIDEILEHIGLTNHFLLILIDKGTRKALQNVHGLELASELERQVFHHEKLAQIGQPAAFRWIRPEHMEPTGNKPLPEIRQELQTQLARLLTNLELLRNGEGVLYKTTMTVNELGKLNLYEYIYFLAQHGLRHVAQMEKNEAEYRAK